MAMSVLLVHSPANATSIDLNDPYPKLDECNDKRSCEDLSKVSLNGIETFIDGIMATQFLSHKLAGATISVVHGDRVLLKKGYGYANLEDRTPVDPDTTLFRPGSISKLFTWTAVMQLVEQGKINLDENVNTYLTQFWIPDAFDTPITMRHLLTHTAGFEDGPLVGLFLEKAEDLVPLASYLKIKMPARVRAPGTYISYSNYGTALAGLIVQNVSGLEFDKYIEEKIYKPLGMKYASFREPLPAHLQPHMATGYYPGPTTLIPRDFEYIHSVGPAGSMSVSAGDMARFMRMHLNNGAYSSCRDFFGCSSVHLLKPETARLMQEQLFTPDPRLPGVAYGFWEVGGPTMRTIGHGGDTIYFHSQLIMVPEQKFGLFVSYNAPDGVAAASELVGAVLRHYFTLEPVDTPEIPNVLEGFEARAETIAGLYRANRRSVTKVDKIASFGVITVRNVGDGLIDVFGYKRLRLREVEPFVFHQVDGPEQLIFKTDDAGKVIHAFIASLPSIGLDKLGPLDAPNLHLLIISAMMIVAIFALYKALRHPVQIFGAQSSARLASITLLVANLLAFVFVVWFGAVMTMGADTLIFGYPPALPMVLALPVLAAPFTFLALWFAAGQWRNGTGPVWGRIKYTANVALLLAFILVLHYWNLLGWNL
jgi:CubicO group peptidase (beta-lactamase class C family)